MENKKQKFKELPIDNSIKVLNILQKSITNNNNLLLEYLNDIKELSDYNDDETFYNNLKDDLDNIENKINLDKNMLLFKPIIMNLIKSFMIMKSRVDIGDNITQKILDEIEDKNLTIESLKQYIIEHQTLLKQNNIQIPEYKPLQLSLQSSVKTPSAISKRLEILNKNNSKTINEWLKGVESNKLIQVPNNVLKEAAKESGVSIKISKDEKNKVLKN
jgi:hypothetical protein